MALPISDLQIIIRGHTMSWNIIFVNKNLLWQKIQFDIDENYTMDELLISIYACH